MVDGTGLQIIIRVSVERSAEPSGRHAFELFDVRRSIGLFGLLDLAPQHLA